jgi:hypothetical protein
MLRISRDDIPTDALVDYGSSSFLRLPLQGYLDAINITPIGPQIALANAVNNPKYRFIVACFSRRVGKTYISNIIGQVKALEPGSTILIIAPDYTLASISWDLQQNFIKAFELETDRNNAKDRVVVLTNGTMIRIASVAKVDSAVGRSYDLIIFDEAALNPDGKRAFNIALRPTLDKINSKCIFISTPRGANYFQEFFERGFSDEFPDWASLHCDWEENPRATPAEIESAKRGMSDAEFEQEYLANFTVFEGQIWNFKEEYVQDLTTLKMRAMEGREEVVGGLDIGFRDNTALAAIACLPGDPTANLDSGNPDWDARKNMYYIIGEYCENRVTTARQAEQIGDLEEMYDIDPIYIDSAAQQTRFDLAQIHDISTINAKKDKLPGINYVASLVENGQLIVDETCVEAVHCLFNYRWDDKSSLEKPVHDRSSHMADAIRYALYTHATGALDF